MEKSWLVWEGAHLVNYLLHIILLNVFLYLGVSKAWAPVPGVLRIAIPVNFYLFGLSLNIKSYERRETCDCSSLL